MRALEKTIFISVSILFLISASIAASIRWHYGQMDNILPVSMVENIYKTGEPLFPEVGLREALLLMPTPPDELCKSDLKPPENKFDNMINWHAYLILYFISPLVAFFSPISIIATFTVFSFFLLAAGCYIFIRKREVPCFPALLFLLMVIAHPAWSKSLLGQVYVDRLFLGPFFFLICMIDSKKRNLIAIFIASCICALINDRLGLICGVFLFGYMVLFFKGTSGYRKAICGLSILLALYSTIVITKFLSNAQYGNFASNFSITSIVANLQNDAFRGKLFTFLSVNFLFFGFLGIFRWQALLLALGLMLPNIFGSIAGAEKVGWYTHYHSTYFPALVWAAASGFSVLYHKLKTPYLRASLYLLLLLCICLQITVPEDFPKNKNLNFSNFQSHILAQNFSELKGYKNKSSGMYAHITFGEDVKKLIPINSTLSTIESVMPLFYDHTRLLYYPIGLHQADYLMLPFVKNLDGKFHYTGAISYLPLTPSERSKMDGCLREKIESEGFDLDHPTTFSNGLALLSRSSK